jgi:very-short-patch-repair endonuclease
MNSTVNIIANCIGLENSFEMFLEGCIDKSNPTNKLRKPRNYKDKMSKLEYIFFTSFHLCMRVPFEYVSFLRHTFLKYEYEYGNKNYILPMLRPQYKCGKFKIDFAIIRKRIKIAIELDGFAYHDRDKNQFNYERERQNYLVSKGYIVLRFTWNMIVNDFTQSAMKIANVINNVDKKYYGDCDD